MVGEREMTEGRLGAWEDEGIPLMGQWVGDDYTLKLLLRVQMAFGCGAIYLFNTVRLLVEKQTANLIDIGARAMCQCHAT